MDSSPESSRSFTTHTTRIRRLQERIPVWNNYEERLITGEDAPSRRNFARYLRIHHFCERYVGQDNDVRPPSITKILESVGLDPDERVMIWNREEGKMLYGSDAPMRGDLPHFLAHNPAWEEFVPWEARVTKKVIRARTNWLKKAHGVSYLFEDMPVPSMLDDVLDRNISFATTPKYLKDPKF